MLNLISVKKMVLFVQIMAFVLFASAVQAYPTQGENIELSGVIYDEPEVVGNGGLEELSPTDLLSLEQANVELDLDTAEGDESARDKRHHGGGGYGK